MNDNSLFHIARARACDEFYTSIDVIEKEMEWQFSQNPDVFRGKIILCPCDDPDRSQFVKYFRDNFGRFGLKRLIATSYVKGGGQYSLDDFLSDRMVSKHGILFDMTSDGIVCGELKGDGDFRSSEVCGFRDEADMIITNPPFSLFRTFFKWCTGKEFMIIGNMGAIIYADVFPHIMKGDVWFGHTIHGGGRHFSVPDDYGLFADGYTESEEGNTIRVKGVRWFMNAGCRSYPDPLPLDTMQDNLSKERLISHIKSTFGLSEYPHYSNYDAIEVPFSENIPSDYDGLMGVPISFLDKFNPSQFRLVGITRPWFEDPAEGITKNLQASVQCADGSEKAMYVRLLIKRV